MFNESVNLIPHLLLIPFLSLIGYAIVSIPPASPSRRLMFVPILISAALVIQQSFQASNNPPWNVFIGCALGGFGLVDAFDLLFVSRVYYDGEARSKKGQPYGFYDSVKWALFNIFSHRKINSPLQCKNVPAFDERNPTWAPSRLSFMARRLLSVMATGLLMDFLTAQPLPDLTRNFAPGKDFPLKRLMDGEMSGEDFGEVFGTVVGFWICGCIAQILCYDFFSLIGVGILLNDPADWPPRYGSVFECHSVRKFWGVFWHQDLRNGIEHNASFVAHSLLRLPRNLFSRYFKISWAFMLSGLFHIINDMLLGVTFPESRAVRFFLLQSVAIIIEDLVQYCWGRTPLGSREATGPRLWQKIFGFIWLCFWLFTVTPMWYFPTLRQAPAFPLPFTIFKP